MMKAKYNIGDIISNNEDDSLYLVEKNEEDLNGYKYYKLMHLGSGKVIYERIRNIDLYNNSSYTLVA